MKNNQERYRNVDRTKKVANKIYRVSRVHRHIHLHKYRDEMKVNCTKRPAKKRRWITSSKISSSGTDSFIFCYFFLCSAQQTAPTNRNPRSIKSYSALRCIFHWAKIHIYIDHSTNTSWQASLSWFHPFFRGYYFSAMCRIFSFCHCYRYTKRSFFSVLSLLCLCRVSIFFLPLYSSFFQSLLAIFYIFRFSMETERYRVKCAQFYSPKNR